MKKIFLSLIAMLVLTLSANAMSYEQARQQALFLTDKMAYELNLTEEQYQAAYEINLDYLMSVNTVDDLYGAYWAQRNADLSYILLDWQYNSYLDAMYFYRPLSFRGGYWRFGIYARYPRRDYYYFECPVYYATYRGSHSWRYNGGRSWYEGRRFVRRNYQRGYFGMRDSFQRNNGEFYGYNGDASNYQSDYQRNRGRVYGGQTRSQFERNRGFGSRESSTRTTVQRPSAGFGSFGGATRSTPSTTYSHPSNSSSSFGSGSFGGHRGGTFNGTPSTSSSFRGGFFGGANRGSFSGSTPTTRSGGTFGGSQNRGSFGGHR